MALKVAADIGGTFTDIAVEDEAGRWSVKLPTTHDAPERAVLDGVDQALAKTGRVLTEVDLFVHGTTLATNALIERKGARTALLTTHGFRDVLEMGNEGRFDQYDLKVERPVPLIPRHLRFTARERLRFDGSTVIPLCEDDVRTAAQSMAAAEVEAVAIVFLHAYANGDHEARARNVLQDLLPNVPISVSQEVSPEMREFERASTTAANAYLQPVVSDYLLRLDRAMKQRGLRRPVLMILSSGSLTTIETASRFPIRLLESGPAGGAIFACDLARRHKLERVLSFDVGGTTAKFCLIDDAKARQARSFEVGRTCRFKRGSGLPMRVPVIDLVEIGAGGGSIARLDAIGRITVGPDSAGSEPGPACYGRGGTAPTVTDCDLVQGKLDPATFAGGSMPLDVVAAERAVAVAIAEPAQLDLSNAAYAVAETVTESMAAAARVHAAEIGAEIEARTLIAFGGGAPLHAARFAEKLGIAEIIVPSGAGVGSAIGFLRAPIAYELTRSVPLLLPDGATASVKEALADMESQAAAVVAGVAPDAQTITTRTAYMRYVGQGHEIEVAVEASLDADDFQQVLAASFVAAYRQLYARVIAEAPIEATSWAVRVVAITGTELGTLSPVSAGSAQAVGERRVWNGRDVRWESWNEYHRSALSIGDVAAGPAVVSEAETTTIVPAGWTTTMLSDGALRLMRDAHK